MSDRTKSRRQDADRRLQSGIEKHFKGAKSISFAGYTFRPAELSKLFQDTIDASDASDAAKRAWLATVVKANETEKRVRPVRRLFRAYLVGLFGDTNPLLTDFGLKPRKTPRVTVATKVQAVKKTLATRKARHTMGKRQKKVITGSVLTASSDVPSSVLDPPTNGSSALHVVVS